MAYRICRTFEIENGHALAKHPGKCRFPHGHSRRVEVVLVADGLDAHDMVCDFSRSKEALKDFVDSWDHALCLNTDDPQFSAFKNAYGERVVGFEHRDPTSEVMARMIFDELGRRLTGAGPGVRVERVRVTETSSTWAEYSE